MKSRKIASLVLSLVMVMSLLSGCIFTVENTSSDDSNLSISELSALSQSESSIVSIAESEETSTWVEVCFIDVGQGDCILINIPGGKHVLIDSGTVESKTEVLRFLENKDVTELEYAFFTHPHADHIGAADEIINTIAIKNVYLPNATTTTQVYERMLTALEAKENINVVQAKAGQSIAIDEITFDILSPIKESYSDINQYSIVIKMTYGETVILFMGDATIENEAALLKAGYDLDADVLKVGHHGSAGSTSVEFLDAVTPDMAIISVGAENDYGHPEDSTLDLLDDIHTYRTDTDGTILVYTDGTEIFKVLLY